MRAYLPSIHYALGWVLMRIFANPVMVGHAVMLLQLGLSAFLIFASVRFAAGTTSAFFAAIWFLHSRHIVERITGGLPRGWAPVLMCAYLYFILKANHRAVLLLSVIGWFLQPVATFLILMAYGFFLLSKFCNPLTRKESLRPCKELALTLCLL